MRVNYNICYVFSLSFKTLIPIKSVKLVRMHHFRSNLDFLNSGLFIQHDLLFTKALIAYVNLVSLLITGHYKK